jgi:hypothetical protein
MAETATMTLPHPSQVHFEKALEAPYPFHGGPVKNLLKDYTTIRCYICDTLD